MDFHHDLAMIAKEELNHKGVVVPKQWNDYQIFMKYIQLKQRWFNSSIPYYVVYSRELLIHWNNLTREEQGAIKDIETRLKTCQTLTPYMSKDIRAIGVKKSDFLLKNWNIYHLHLERHDTKGRYTNQNLLFFQPYKQVVHMIDVKPHPKGNGWFDKTLFSTIYDNWPWLLRYREGMYPTITISDDDIHKLLQQAVSVVPFRNGCLFPTNYGVSASGDSSLAVSIANHMFNRLTCKQLELTAKVDDIKKEIKRANLPIPKLIDFNLIIENGYFVAYEKTCHFKIQMFPVPLEIGSL